MKTLWAPEDRQNLLARIDQIADMTLPHWGSFTADRMLAHLAQSLKMATGELAVQPKRVPLPLRYFPVKHVVIYLLPFPKGVPTARELLAGAPAPVETVRAELHRLMDDFGSRTSQNSWPPHPAFGKLTGKQWGVLTYRHLDHHLRQFGV